MNKKNASVDKQRIVITEQAHGQRLDQVIAPLFPYMGVRGRRRLWEHRVFTVNGRARPCGYSVAAGDVVEVHAMDAGRTVHESQNVHKGIAQHIRIISVNNALGLAAILKPSGIHSAAIAGSPLPSVEALLPQLFLADNKTICTPPFPKLLNRLDGPTSGMLLVALNQTGLDTWTQAEELGIIEKSYFALVCGVVESDQLVKVALNTTNRQVTTILDHESTDTLRHTTVEPLAVFTMLVQVFAEDDVNKINQSNMLQTVTLVRCRIHKGARHQIRAHMASIGHALLGDNVYGTMQARDAQGQLFLHHGRVQLSDFTAYCAPSWLSFLPTEAQENIKI